MKRLELDIKKCNECPYLRANDSAATWSIYYTCMRSRTVVGEFTDPTVIQDECPLPDKQKENFSYIYYDSNATECPNCGTSGEVYATKCDLKGVHESYQCPKCKLIWGDNF